MQRRTKKKFRSEWKYCVDEPDLLALKQRLLGVMEHDFHAGESGKYTIHSLYFDDYQNTCAKENVAGEGIRFKWRIRYYGDSSDKLFLEKKEKINTFCHKRSCRLSREVYDAIVEGNLHDLYWKTEDALLKEFYIDIMSKGFIPRVIVNYEREAFVEIVSNIRITLDYNISASEEFDRFLQGDYFKIPILPKRKHVLEVKFDDVLPSYIRNTVQVKALGQQSFSKYYLGRQTLQEYHLS